MAHRIWPLYDGYRSATETYQRDGVMLAGEALAGHVDRANNGTLRNGRPKPWTDHLQNQEQPWRVFYMLNAPILTMPIKLRR